MEKHRHLSKALHNEEFFKSFDLDKTKYRDWVIVGIFYTAIHYYEAYFSDSNKHSRTHDIADDWIAEDPKISDTYGDYRELKESRWYASYWSKIFTAQEIRDIILPKLYNIKKSILSLLNK